MQRYDSLMCFELFLDNSGSTWQGCVSFIRIRPHRQCVSTLNSLLVFVSSGDSLMIIKVYRNGNLILYNMVLTAA